MSLSSTEDTSASPISTERRKKPQTSSSATRRQQSRSCTQSQIAQVHIADGFYDDCDELINRCSQLSIIDYQSFCHIWKDMNLGFLYQGRSAGAEIAELSEELIHIAKHYMVKDTANFEESVAGLFLVYGLLTLQPYRNFALIRIVPDDVPALRRIEMVARREKRYDVLYILGDILINRSQYHAVERERGLERSYRKYLEGCTSIDRLGVRPKGVFYRQNEELDIIRELGALTRQYGRAKNNVTGTGSNPSLHYIDEGLSDELGASLRRLVNGLTEEFSTLGDDEEEEKHSETVQSIKHRAMQNVVDPMRHLTAVGDRKTQNTQNTHQSDLKSPKGKVKGGSPTKPIPGTTKKRPKKQSPRKSKRLKITDVVDYDSEILAPDNSSGDEKEINLKEFHKDAQLPDLGSDKKPGDEENAEVIAEEDNLDIEIESLPVIIRTGNTGQMLEIEIFDEYEGDKDTADEQKPSTSDTGNGDKKTKKKIIKKKAALSVKLKTPKCRDLKRNALKSKFKKMGMLPAANFLETSKD